MTSGAFFAWFVVGPVLWIKVLNHGSSSFGEISFVLSAVMMAAGSVINAKMITRFGSSRLLFLGWAVMFVSGFLFLTGSYWWGLNSFTLFVPMSLLYFGSTLIWPNVFSNAFTPLGHIAGFATAVYAMGQNLGGFILGGVMAHCPDHTPVYMGVVIMICSLLALLSYRGFILKRKIYSACMPRIIRS